MKRLILSAGSFLVFSLSLTAAADCDYNYDQKVELIGKLMTMEIQIDEEEAEDLPIGDGTWPAIILEQPVNVCPVNGEEDELSPVEEDVDTLQLVLSEENWSLFRENEGQAVTVQCELFHAHNIYHRSAVLCNAISITAADTL